jgi:hypothetical protein
MVPPKAVYHSKRRTPNKNAEEKTHLKEYFLEHPQQVSFSDNTDNDALLGNQHGRVVLQQTRNKRQRRIIVN